MRGLFLLLLLANVLYFGWEFNQQLAPGRGRPPVSAALPPEVGELTLLGELAEPPLPRVAAPAQTPLLPEPAAPATQQGASTSSAASGEPVPDEPDRLPAVVSEAEPQPAAAPDVATLPEPPEAAPDGESELPAWRRLDNGVQPPPSTP